MEAEMKITRPGTDLVVVDENTLSDSSRNSNRVHLIKFQFETPTEEKVFQAMKMFEETNRFVISDNIKIYNDILRRTNKKYYIENIPGTPLVSFFRRNNKVLLNLMNLLEFEKQFVLNVALEDVLRNTEVILGEKEDYEFKNEEFNRWRGNFIIFDPSYLV